MKSLASVDQTHPWLKPWWQFCFCVHAVYQALEILWLNDRPSYISGMYRQKVLSLTHELLLFPSILLHVSLTPVFMPSNLLSIHTLESFIFVCMEFCCIC